MSSQTFAFSNQLLTRRQRMFTVLMSIVIFIPLGVLIFVAGFHLDRFLRGLPFALAMMIFPALLGFLFHRYVFAQWREQSLILTPVALELVGRHQQRRIAWQDVEHLRIRERPNGQLQTISVIPRTGMSITLVGFEPMADVLRALQQHLSPTISVETKREKLDTDNPRTLVGILLLNACFLGIIVWLIGFRSFQAGFAVFQFGIGLYFLIYQPGSRTNPALRKVDIAIGLLTLVGSSVILILRLAIWLGWIH